MAWWYNNRKKLKEGRSWYDDNGVKHRYNWIKWSDLTKKIHGLTWEAENVRPIKINIPEVNPTIILQFAEFTFDLSSFNLDASINLKVIIDNIVVAAVVDVIDFDQDNKIKEIRAYKR